jgi:hypothetical protein
MWRKCGGSHEESLETLENQEVTIEMKLGIVGDLLDFIFPCILL